MSETAERVLSEFLGRDSARRICLTPIPGGQSGACLYRFDLEGQTCVLRLLNPTTAGPRHRHEVLLTRAADTLGVGPRFHFAAANDAAIIYDYTPGDILSLEDLEEESIATTLARKLAQLHRGNIEIPAAVSPFERFRGFRQRALDRGTPWPETMIHASDFMSKVEKVLPPVAPRPTHLDLHARNIIVTPQRDLRFIDWVNGGGSDPIFDLATTIVFLGLADDRREHFLTRYQESTGESIDETRLEWLLPIRPFVAAASSLVNTPHDIDMEQVEQEVLRDERPGHELFSLPFEVRPKWPVWKWGVAALRMGLEHLPAKFAHRSR